MIKDALREKMREKRRTLTNDKVKEKSAQIHAALFSLDCFKNAQTICTFISAFKEPDTVEIIKRLLGDGKMVVVPVTDTENTTLILSYIENMSDLKKGAFGILEPTVIKPARESDIDAVLVPGLAFDRCGGRMGFGKGYYDRFLEKTDAVKISLCYDFQLFDKIPTEPHDVPMDIIITESGVMEVTRINVNSEYTVKIESVSSDGNGICHIGGMAVFVPFTAAGDEVKIKITNVKKRFCEAKVTEIISPSPDRTAPDCEVYEKCGGCSLRHIKYLRQLEIKREIVNNAMRRIGGFKDFAVSEIIGAENPSRYRNKTIFHAEKNNIGFYGAKSHSVVPVTNCAIGAEENADIIRAVSRFGISELFMRKSFSTGDIMVCVKAENTDAEKLTAAVLGACKNVKSIYLNGENIYGAPTIYDTLCGIKFSISPESFFQVNPVQTEKLYAKALEFAALDKTMTVMDIYCGIGTISLCAAQKAKRVIGVEIVERAIEDAKENAKLNGITNAEFFADSAERIVPRLIKSGEAPDVVILDPPRKGSDEKTLGAILKARPKRIVYVSCNPATLARDARILSDGGYTISDAAAVDLFPHTSHVETVLVMKR